MNSSVRGLWPYSGLVLLAGLVAWGWTCSRLPWNLPDWGSLLALGATCIYAEVRSLYVAGYGVINFGEGLYFGATLRYGAPVAALFTCLLGLGADLSKKKDPAILVFNLGWSLCTFSAIGWAAQSFHPELGLSLGNCLALLAGTLAYAGVAALLQAGCQTYMERMPLRETLRHQLKGMRLGAPAALILGVFGDILMQLAPWAIVLALFPVEIFTAYVRVNQLHQELLATQGQLQANSRQAALGVLTAGVAHEINNPLAAMATSIHLLKRQDLDSKGEMCLNLLSQGLERCQSITNRMLLYSRPPENRPTSCNPAEVVQDAMLFLGGRVGKSRVEVSPEVAQSPVVACDPGVLVQVLTNLLTNAADAFPEGKAGQIHIGLELSPGQLRLLVRDNGTGISAKVQERMWEPFFTTKEVGKGTGLGLAISLSLIQSAGGQLRLRETSPQGTTFEIALPQTNPGQ